MGAETLTQQCGCGREIDASLVGQRHWADHADGCSRGQLRQGPHTTWSVMEPDGSVKSFEFTEDIGCAVEEYRAALAAHESAEKRTVTARQELSGAEQSESDALDRLKFAQQNLLRAAR